MYRYDEREQTITRLFADGEDGAVCVQDTYVQLGFRQHAILYEPAEPGERSQIGVVIIHSDSDYSTFPIGGELAKRGYRTLCGQVSDPSGTMDRKILDVGAAVSFLRSLPGITKVVLMGHSGGATLMSAYQAAAEAGPAVFTGDHMLVPCALSRAVPPADGVMILDSNFGNGAMTLFSIDPAVRQEGNGLDLDPELDAYNPANGYDPAGSEYSDAFLTRFWKAQAERNNALIRHALERLAALEAGHGLYTDDEPLVLTGASQVAPCNKIFPEDLRFISHTKRAHTLLLGNGKESVEVVHSVRKARGGSSPTGRSHSCEVSTVRSFLSNRAVLAGENYRIYPDGAEGILWEDTCNCTPANIRFVTVPLLAMGMTGSYEYLAAEAVYDNAASTDKTIAFAAGASHNFFPADADCARAYGDTAATVFDYAAAWMAQPGRFL